MESQPQNPDFRSNSENFNPCSLSILLFTCYCQSLITSIANFVDQDQLGPTKCLNEMVL